jgi:hypothetical protein
VEFLLSVLAAALGGLGVFTSTGLVEVCADAIRQIWRQREREQAEFSTYKARRSVKAGTEGELAETEDEEKMRKDFKASRIPEPSQGAFPSNLFYALFLVGCVFAIAIGVVYTLTHIGGPLQATINATIAKAGGSILIVGGGLFAAFLVVSLMAFVAIHVFSGR